MSKVCRGRAPAASGRSQSACQTRCVPDRRCVTGDRGL